MGNGDLLLLYNYTTVLPETKYMPALEFLKYGQIIRVFTYGSDWQHPQSNLHRLHPCPENFSKHFQLRYILLFVIH